MHFGPKRHGQERDAQVFSDKASPDRFRLPSFNRWCRASRLFWSVALMSWAVARQ